MFRVWNDEMLHTLKMGQSIKIAKIVDEFRKEIVPFDKADWHKSETESSLAKGKDNDELREW